jgi:membrane dipeptidase
MPSNREIDPLLPQNDPAPEILGNQNYGTRRAQMSNNEGPNKEPVNYQQDVTNDEDEDDASPTTSTKSALSTIIALFSVVVFFAFVTMLLSPSDGDSILPLPRPQPSRTVEERVRTILSETPLIDGHNDLAIFIRGAYKNQIHTKDFRKKFEEGHMELNVDLPRLKSGMVGGALWSAFVVCPENASDDFSDAQYATAVSHTLSQIDLIRRLQAQYPEKFTPAISSPSLALSRFHDSHSLVSPISIEGLHQIPQSAPLSTLRLYYTLGVRAATLTWNCHNAFADAALISTSKGTHIAPYHRGGLTAAGREVIHEMNRLGMLIDISHTSYWTQRSVLSNNTSLAPVIYSHSSAFTLCQHPRNVHDDNLELVKRTNSLVMVNFSPDFISCLPPPDNTTLPEFYEKNNTLHQVARHIVYIGDKIGYDHVGLGSDYDGMGSLTPRGLEGVDKYPDLVKELLTMGVSDADASKVVGGNFLRVWKAANQVAQKLQKEEHEGEDEVHGYLEDRALLGLDEEK